MVTLLLEVLIILAIIGLILWAVRQIPGIPPIVITIIYVVFGVVILLWILQWVEGGRPLLPLR